MESQQVSHYQLGRMLGRGGMGEVYEAVDLNLDRRVALKFIAPELAADPESLRRFEREARSAAALTHPHIATLYEFVRDGPRPFIAMELITGASLRAKIGAGPLPIAEALGIARDVASALAAAHRRGIVHRDIKPENLMLDEHGAIKVMDFGLARATQASRLTMTGTTLGTAGYMAPEAIRGEPGMPADVFALGAVLHEMLAGELPFKGDNPLALMYSISNMPARPLREVRPETPEAVEVLVLRVLEKDPEQRPDAATLAHELGVLTGVRAAGLEATTLELEIERVPPSVPAKVEGVFPARRRSWRARALVAAVLVVVAMLAGFGWRERDRRNAVAALDLQTRGKTAHQEGRIDEAQSLYQQALRRNPKNAGALGNLALIYMDRGRLTTADSLLRAMLRHTPRDPVLQAAAHASLAEIRMRELAWSAAVQDLERAFALDSSSANAYNNLGYALIRNQQLAAAVAVLRRGVKRFPGEAFLFKNVADAELQMGEAKGALPDLDRALALAPDLASARGLRAEARAQAGDLAGARADWRIYAAARTDSAERARIARVLAERGVPLEPTGAP